ncbi:MAG: peptidase [Oceanospirillaceae bacterium]|nr:peptidase [Oceanospirillaceae bacterium]
MKFFPTLALSAAIGIAALSSGVQAQTPAAAVIKHYGDIAQATFEDSLSTAKALQVNIAAFLDKPTAATLASAKKSWIAARAPYQQTEAYRFGNAIVDDWEGKVNAWPLDEGLIDYVASEYGTESDENPYYAANIIANPKLSIGGVEVDASKITPALLSDTLQEIDEVESNVATGYHAIEFLLWGQDLNGTEKGAGNRAATDYSLTDCTNGNCDRRRDYLSAATALLITDLEEMTANWQPAGAARVELAAKGDKGGLATILTGMGSLSYGELAGERIKLGLIVHDPEEEHDCFSDNTHFSHFYDAMSIKNVYTGEYKRVDGTVLKGPSLSTLVAAAATGVDAKLTSELNQTEKYMQVMVDEAAKGNTFDVLIGSGNTAGNAVVQDVVDALTAQTKSIEAAISALKLDDIELEGSDSLDNPASITAG